MNTIWLSVPPPNIQKPMAMGMHKTTVTLIGLSSLTWPASNWLDSGAGWGCTPVAHWLTNVHGSNPPSPHTHTHTHTHTHSCRRSTSWQHGSPTHRRINRRVSDRLHLNACMHGTWEDPPELVKLVTNTSSSHHVKSDTRTLLVVWTSTIWARLFERRYVISHVANSTW